MTRTNWERDKLPVLSHLGGLIITPHLSGQQPEAEAAAKPEVRDSVRSAGGAEG